MAYASISRQNHSEKGGLKCSDTCTAERNSRPKGPLVIGRTATALLDMTSLFPHLSPCSPPAFQPRTRPEWADGQVASSHTWASVITLTYGRSDH